MLNVRFYIYSEVPLIRLLSLLLDSFIYGKSKQNNFVLFCETYSRLHKDLNKH